MIVRVELCGINWYNLHSLAQIFKCSTKEARQKVEQSKIAYWLYDNRVMLIPEDQLELLK